MIREIGTELAARLEAKGVPVPVVDGPENPTTMWGRERIVIEHDDGADSFGPPRSHRRNPSHRYTRTMSCKMTIFAKSPAAGAAIFEHRRRAERILDKVLCAMDYVAAVRKNHWAPKSGKYITPPDLAGSENPAGAVYELSFEFDRAVMDQTWAGANRPESTMSLVSMAGSPQLTFTDFDVTGDTIERDTGSWITDGFAVGMTIRVHGSESNNGSFVIEDISATVITLGDAELANEGPVSGCVVRAGGSTHLTKVSLTHGVDDDGDPNTVPASAEIACGV